MKWLFKGRSKTLSGQKENLRWILRVFARRSGSFGGIGRIFKSRESIIGEEMSFCFDRLHLTCYTNAQKRGTLYLKLRIWSDSRCTYYTTGLVSCP